MGAAAVRGKKYAYKIDVMGVVVTVPWFVTMAAAHATFPAAFVQFRTLRRRRRRRGRWSHRRARHLGTAARNSGRAASRGWGRPGLRTGGPWYRLPYGMRVGQAGQPAHAYLSTGKD
jgi:hypothetical protein